MTTTRTVASMLFASLLMGITFIAPTKTSSQIRRETPKTSDQSLTGDKAVNELKRSGGYDSLEEAFKKASGMSLSDPEPANLFPGGAYEQVALTAGDAVAGDQFGTSVAVSGDIAVVGANFYNVGSNNDQGAAYVFVRSDNTWTQQAQLLASDGAASDLFGISVAASGDTIVVGASRDDIGTNSDQGSAYVFTRSGTTWTQQQKLEVATGGAVGDWFGVSVSVSGDTVVIGASRDNIGSISDQGSAFVFTRSGGTWTQQQNLVASDGAATDYFGTSVSVSGETIVVGASRDDVGSNTDQGSAYVFTRSGSTWTQQSKLTADDGAQEDYFGFSVAVSGDTAVVGASGDNVNTVSNQGSAYVFTRSGATWTQQQRLIASDGGTGAEFGYSVSISGETVVAAARRDDVGSNTDQGSAYMFTRSGSTWWQQHKFIATDGAQDDYFGSSVAVSGDTVVVGALSDDVGANVDQGSVKIFQTRISITQASPFENPGFFGYSVAVSGDTAVVGTGNNARATYVFTRSGSTWTQQAKLVPPGPTSTDLFGNSVAIDGNTLVVGAPFDQIGGNSQQGSAYIFTRSGTTWTQQQKLTAPDGSVIDNFGVSVAVSGDTAIIGAWQDEIGGTLFQGSAYVFTRSGTSWTQQQKLTASDGEYGDCFGYSVALYGGNAVIGAYLDDHESNSDQGSVYVFTRSGTTWTQQAKLVASDGAASDQFGTSVAISGDTAVVGVPYDDFGLNINQGSAYVFTRLGTTWTQKAKLVASDGVGDDSFGHSVAVDGSTIVVGSPFDDIDGNDQQGSTYVFVGSESIWEQDRKLIRANGNPVDNFGWSVAVSSNTAVIGAPFSIGADFAPSGALPGAAYMYYWGPLNAPTSAGASLSGRVLETNGRGLANATVVLTDSMGVERTVQTGSFGRFSFSDLPSGETYIVSVRSRRFVFSPQVVSLQSDLSDVRLEASGRSGR